MILIMRELNFLCLKIILTKLKKTKQKKTFASMFSDMKINWLFLFTYQNKNLEIHWIRGMYLMKINHIMYTSKILTDLCFTKQKIKISNTFAKVGNSVLVVKCSDRT